MTPKAWELWYALVPFEDESISKDRPVVVIDPEKRLVLCVPITSHGARNAYGEYEIVHWQKAGLDHPSTARVTRIIQLEVTAFRRKIGILELVDIAGLRKLL